VSDTGVAHFIKNLRNFVLHRDLPSIAGQISFSQGDDGIKSDTLLDPERLLHWRKCDSESKQFISEHNPISLSRTIIEDFVRLLEFYANFKSYSLDNVCLILMQKSTA
jgi:hypothetical protein